MALRRNVQVGESDGERGIVNMNESLVQMAISFNFVFQLNIDFIFFIHSQFWSRSHRTNNKIQFRMCMKIKKIHRNPNEQWYYMLAHQGMQWVSLDFIHGGGLFDL